MRLSVKERRCFDQLIKRLLSIPEFAQMARYPQHGSTSCLAHSIAVAYLSYWLCRRLHLNIRYKSLIRGALLHDFFLYDWHDKEDGHKRPHGFYHPSAALANAERDFEINSRTKNIIKRHMFPLTPIPPVCLEGWVVCIADKICSTKETIKRH